MTEQYQNVRRVALLVGAALLGAHFLITALSQAPLSPAKLRYHSGVNAYLEPYFTQNWLLFAPAPLADDRGVLARAKCRDDATTQFYDVTAPHIKAVQGSRFFPSRTSRLVTNSLQQIYNTDEVMERFREKAKNDKKPLPPLMPHERDSRADSIRFLSRYSLGQLPHACAGKPQAIQVRMYVHELPPWSKRGNPKAEGKIEVEDFPWRRADDL